MTYEVVFARRAERDLRDIYEYVAYEIGEPQTAARLMGRIRAAVESLGNFPGRRPLVGFEPWCSRQVRWMLVGSYLVFYMTDEKEGVVSVIRVMYGGRDAEAELGRIIG